MEDKKTKREIMLSHIEACSNSGMSVTDYCRVQNLQKSTYYYWHKRLVSGGLNNSFSQILPQKGPPRDDASIVIDFPNGVSVSLNGYIDPKAVRELICCM